MYVGRVPLLSLFLSNYTQSRSVSSLDSLSSLIAVDCAKHVSDGHKGHFRLTPHTHLKPNDDSFFKITGSTNFDVAVPNTREYATSTCLGGVY